MAVASADSKDLADRSGGIGGVRRRRRRQHFGPVSRPCSPRSPFRRDRGHARTSMSTLDPVTVPCRVTTDEQIHFRRSHGTLFNVGFSMTVSAFQQQKYSNNFTVTSLQDNSHLQHGVCCILSRRHIRRRRRRLGARRRRRRQHFRCRRPARQCPNGLEAVPASR